MHRFLSGGCCFREDHGHDHQPAGRLVAAVALRFAMAQLAAPRCFRFQPTSLALCVAGAGAAAGADGTRVQEPVGQVHGLVWTAVACKGSGA